MKRIASARIQTRTSLLAFTGLVFAVLLMFALPAHADKKAEARDQFERAVRMRTTLEGHPPKERTLADYKQAIAAYHKVYLITPQAEEVTPSLIAEGELYQEMGRHFDAKYFKSAIDTYSFLLKQYPGSRYRDEALFSMGQIQKDDLDLPDAAETTFKDFVKRFPQSDKADGAREALKEIADAREDAKEQAAEAKNAAVTAAASAIPKTAAENATLPAEKGSVVEQREAAGRIPHVMDIHTWNAQNYTRIVVTLEDTIRYDAVRIASPDRIYFDLYKANLTPSLAKKALNVDNGLLKSVRLAQNKQGVVRLVLDVDGAKDYSAFLLSKPYRLVIEVHAQPESAVKPSAEKPEAKADLKSAGQPSETVSASASKPAQPTPAAAKPPLNSASGKHPDTTKVAALKPPTEPKPTRDGQLPLTRALGLKISRIVIDPGHGGHDTGTIGPHGLMEKDLCLDVALRLGHLIEQKLPGAQVVYTRKDDTFIPLEDRTAMANDAKADLFISIHANSSHDSAARGIETYYLNFATSEESMEVAARENALSQQSLHDLQDLIKKIARNEKIEESKELAIDIQDSLAHRMQVISQSEKNRGVKKAPFVVLIGANMPSVLTEISFISNPNDEKLLRKADQRQRVADGLYRGIASYLDNLNSLSYSKSSKLISDSHAGAGVGAATVASDGNPK